MCLACEMGLWMDDVPAEPPPGFPRARPEEPSPFACDAPQDVKPEPPAEASDGERKP